jgi:hypothetical protein
MLVSESEKGIDSKDGRSVDLPILDEIGPAT